MIHEVTETPRQARRQASIERILDAAEEIVAVEGFDALTMHRLAQALGTTVGATYRYFASKEALLAGLQERVFSTLAEDLGKALERQAEARPRKSKRGALERVALLALTYATLHVRRPTDARLLARWIAHPENLLEADLGARNAARALALGGVALRTFEEARLAGALDDGDDLERVLVLWASLSGTAFARKLERWQVPGLEASSLSTSLLRSLLRGWGADGGRVDEAIERASALASGEGA